MKKNKVSLSNLKVQSFVTQVPTAKKVVGGGESVFNTVCYLCTGDFGSDCIQAPTGGGSEFQ